MGVFTDKMEVTTKIPPARMFRALVFVPKAIQNVELIEGDGGTGSIKKIIFGEGSQVKYVKHKIETIDEKGFSFNYSLIEGDALMNNLEKISHDFKFMAAPNGGSICNISISSHYTIGDIYIKQEDVKAEREKGLGLLKAVEAYLLANRGASQTRRDQQSSINGGGRRFDATCAIRQRLKPSDFVIVRDARIPLSSAHEELQPHLSAKRHVIALNEKLSSSLMAVAEHPSSAEARQFSSAAVEQPSSAASKQSSSAAIKFKAMLQLGSSRAAQLGSSKAAKLNSTPAQQNQSSPARQRQSPKQRTSSAAAQQPSSVATKQSTSAAAKLKAVHRLGRSKAVQHHLAFLSKPTA
ncbi:hypothetical protein SLEP1_g57103 [Rubroshorea leprosula]|uniref:Bet v I/Major latex protein domain-containing protein n=1 Tax=Rubroshorea leprosula TaxID=152421 RepID=A0AAV5MPQ7_9ROSI|nr:hypothetical protein SLEP1_g57103 [Rubroshorea leprosula]